MLKRRLGRSNIEVGALALGCFAIGGPFWRADGGTPWQEADENGLTPGGWGAVDDAESIRAIQAALDHGVTLFDTSDSYGIGHSEVVLGRSVEDCRDKVVIATKFGNQVDVEKKIYIGHQADPDFIRQSCEGSLRRLNTDYIDVYQLHWSGYDGDLEDIISTLEALVQEGKIRWYGWSTDDAARMKLMAEGEHCAVVQHGMSILRRSPIDDMLALCKAADLGSIVRSPLNMGLLTGKFSAESAFDKADIRYGWDLSDDESQELLQTLDRLRDVLTSDGRTMTQGAIAWIWNRSEISIPLVGFKTMQQVIENAGAMEHGLLSAEQYEQVETIMGR